MGKTNPSLYGNKYSLLSDVQKAFQKMKSAAYEDGISLKVVESYIDFETLALQWDIAFIEANEGRKLPEKIIDEMVETIPIPGTSRHHWGTEVDLIQDLRTYQGEALQIEHFEPDGAFFEMHQWLQKNAADYGFYMVYTKHKKRKGMRYKPWQYSYAPLSKLYLKGLLRIPLMRIIPSLDVEGTSHFSPSFVENYIFDNLLNIHPALR
ncbi:MAG: D-alanyl-D-alanine carboxypeptidase family protein [Flavobacteriaceae bacterium]|nr:D-alanyl-D-alanine carboxypeptidase family protein [Flavobacteriaceae bacterium]